MSSLIRILIADDMEPIREYLKMVIGHEPGMEIVGTVATGADAVEWAMLTKPDVVLMDLEMESRLAGVEAIRRILAELPQTRCVVLTHFSDDSSIYAAFEAGAVDYVIKNSSVNEILEAIRNAAADCSPIRPQVARKILEEFRILRSERVTLVNTLNIVYKLTPTELSFLKMLAEGKTKQEIAAIRHVEPSTIRTHVGNILKKFGEKSVADVVNRLKTLGIFDIFDGFDEQVENK